MVGCRWIYKVKRATDESVEKYKAHFVTKGFSQEEGIDYKETFAPVARCSDHYLFSSRDGLASPSDGRQDCLPQWSDRGGGVY